MDEDGTGGRIEEKKVVNERNVTIVGLKMAIILPTRQWYAPSVVINDALITPEYATAFQSMPEYGRVCQSMPEYARVCQSMPEYARICQSMLEYARVCQSVPEYARVCQSITEYARVCQSVPEYTRVLPSFAKVVPKSSPSHPQVVPR